MKAKCHQNHINAPYNIFIPVTSISGQNLLVFWANGHTDRPTHTQAHTRTEKNNTRLAQHSLRAGNNVRGADVHDVFSRRKFN